MKTTVDIPDDVLEEAMAVTGARTKREAIVTAIREFNLRRRREAIAARLGSFDGFPTARQVQRERRRA